MKRTLTGMCLWALGSMSSSGASMQVSVDRLINRLNPHVNLGIVVVDLSSGQTLYSRNAERLYIPASNMKLFSEAATLMALGPDYRFKNQLSTSANQLQQGVLHGNLYLHLSGDPSFTRNDLRTLLASLKEWKITAIQGDVVIDSSLASVNAYPPGWLTSDLSYSYGAPIAPLMLDSNRLTVTVNPGAKAGDPAIVEVEDDNEGAIVINNQAKTAANAKGCGVGFTLDQENKLTVRGCVALGQWAVQQRLAIKNPLMYAQGMIKNQLAKANIQLDGQVHLGTAPSGSLLIATEHSRPISQLMADTLKPSDNLYADSLYLHTAAKINGSPVNWNEAQPVIKNFLQQQTGIDLKKSIFTDGSGLSRYNLVTPEQTISLLKFLYQRFPLSYEYIAALPISGRDGTLQKRFKIPTQQGFVRAKTGTMTGMNSLSGYLYTANGHTLAFAMFINRLPGKSAGPGRPLLDALCTYFLQQSPVSSRLARVFAPHSRIKFQTNPTQGEVQRSHQAKWRRLESLIRLALKGQAVNVVYRGNELIVTDNQSDARKVWAALQSVAKKYPFAVALSSKVLSISPTGKPMMLWMQTPTVTNQEQRSWIIREAV
ncbi:D-alanyl-D-alanine carboxypeptidase/D-alanyl-D-alanine endopeptidase [Legionella maioricensis]|uniref:D-alanyl-D-alanine carboxypeptidase/D-alanyl-D-alanine-endopeptidase n=1 Tax=Legionella maioricensis TaxID=2896528 RepID=A0A9X2IBB8_9GAMM|nr:D-alanyl-D-alanine carboxypeptidase/D-alanyl-D-alanine-endopeptidase [Legionella maioricensis]MCL9684799.1 D-alanyl-D-alanine carboxypeptidase/D-alanyl-D-alanine-endopeptidase [Legionella maioricensis]MCL9687799.1 D-alanyl-D-alanine carboxypeptidase/D-alanyl-D-alanine-endopeptidase [Legionella maioricensis]